MYRHSLLKTTRVAMAPTLALAVLLGLWLALNGPTIVHATPPIAENPVSTGNASEVITAVERVRAVATADLDRNGRTDLALADGDQIQIMVNTGITTPVWSAPSDVGSMDAPVIDLATADLDRDGRIDILAAARDAAGDSQLRLWQNPTAAMSPWTVSHTLTSTAPITLTTLAVGDLDGDGAPDLAAAGHDGLIRLWRNPLTGTQPFTTAWGSPTELGPVGAEINQLNLADFDHDGRPDIVAVMGGASPSVRLWQNPLAEGQPFTTPWLVGNTLGTLGDDGLSVAVADYDGNGTPDVAAGDAAGAVWVWSNPLTETQPFVTSWGSPASVGNSGAPVDALACGDMDDDGRPDLAGGNETAPSTLLAWRNPGAPFASAWPTVTVGTRTDSIHALTLADLEPDGDLDVVSGAGDASSGHVVLWPNALIHRDVPVGPRVALDAQGHHSGIQFGDVDGDSHPDIVTQDSVGSLVFWENSDSPFGDPGWSEHAINPYGRVRPLALADIDDDGILDIVAGNTYTTAGEKYWQLELWYSDGDPLNMSSWNNQLVGYLPAQAQTAGVGDADKDGRPEIVVGTGTGAYTPTSDANAVWLWRYDDDPFASTWISAQVGVATYTISSLQLSDLDNDGQMDIVFSTWHAPVVGSDSNQRPRTEWFDAYQLRAFRNDGDPWGGGWTAFDLGRDPMPRTLDIAYHGFWGASIRFADTADFDNDGYVDIVTAEGYEGDFQIMIWENDGTPFDGELWLPTTAGLGPGWETQGDPWLQDSVNSVIAADMNDDGLPDIVSGSDSAEPYEIIYWENSGTPFGESVTDTHWIRHNLGATNLGGTVSAPMDLDGDGDEDIVSLSQSFMAVDVLYVWQNLAGSVGLVPADTAPLAYSQGTTRELMRVAVSHHGKAVDRDVELSEWRLTLQDITGTALTTAQADALFAELAVYRDANGDDVWQSGDTPVVAVSSPLLTDGVQTLSFSPGDAAAAISATQSVTYFVVATLEATIDLQMPAAFQIVFDPDAAAVVRDRVNGASVSLNDSESITVGPVQILGPVASINLAANPASITADGVSTSVVTATLLDARSQAVEDGTPITFTSSLGTLPASPHVTTTSGGVATTTLTASTTAGPAVITAIAGGQSATTTVTLAPGPLDHVAVNPPAVTLTPAATQLFVASGYDQHNNEISGLSFDWSVVNGGGSIDGNGLFTANTTPGIHPDTVQVESGGLTATASVTVTVGPLDHIVVDPPAVTLALTGTQLFTASAYDSYNNEISGLSFNWSVVNGGGSINSSGLFTAGTTAGSFLDTVQAESGGVIGTASVTVNPGALDHVNLSPPAVELAAGDSQPFTASGYDRYENEIGGLSFNWSVVNGGGSINSSGLFTAGLTPGVYTDTVQAESGGITGSATVTVTPAALDYIVVSPSSVTLTPTVVQPFTASGYDRYDNEISGLTFAWNVVNGGGTINSSGLFTASTSAGVYTDTIQAVADSITGTASVTIVPDVLHHVNLYPPTLVLAPGAAHPFTASGHDLYENEISGLSFNWSVVNGGGSINSSGVFTAGTMFGTYTDTVQAETGGITGTATVIVASDVLDHIVVEPSVVMLRPRATQLFQATGYDQYENMVGGLTFAWDVVNGGGSIDNSGLFTASATSGVYPDTVQATAGGVTGTASVAIAPGPLHHVVVEPPNATLALTATQLFVAAGYDQYDNQINGFSFNWSVINGGGTINSSGLFTAGLTAGTYTDTVQAETDGITGTATVTVVPGALEHVVVSPVSVTLSSSATQLFTASGYDRYDNQISALSLAWDVVNGGGSIDSSGLFTAGPTPGVYSDTVRATASGVSGYASVTVIEDEYLVFLPLVVRGQ